MDFEGNWRMNTKKLVCMNKHGWGILKDKDGVTFEGLFEDGMKSSLFKVTSQDGIVSYK